MNYYRSIKLSYSEIQTISERDRDIVWSISKTYNHIEENTIEVPKIKQKTLKLKNNETRK